MEIKFGEAITDIFKTPLKWNTILLLSVCVIIPIVGPLVFLGYLLQRFSRKRRGMGEPEFTFDLFSEYLTIGLWPFLSSLLVSVVAMPFMIIAYLPIVGGIFFAEENPTIMVVLVLLGFIFMLIVFGLIMLVSFPVILRSGLMMDFGAGFSWPFIKSFIRKVGVSLFGWYMLLLLISIPASLIGMLALYVGALLVSTITMFAMYHILFQHYDLFLERGGEEIQVHPRVLGVPPIPSKSAQLEM